MDKEDNRGWKHRVNKKKNRSKPGSHVPPPKPKVKLDSNWDRYEQEPSETKINSSTDFSVLANAPITHGSHFQFKSDKDIAAEILEPVESSKLFSLDLASLDKSLSTIPFIIRSGINEKYFSESERRRLTALDDKISDYSSYINSRKTEPDVIFGSKVEELDQDTEVEPEISETKPGERNESDLEQWLDDVLDD